MITKYCVVCGSKNNLQNHHFIPVILGGTDDEKNIITLCETHHDFIHNRKKELDINNLMKLQRQKMIKKGWYTGGKIPFGFKIIKTGKFRKNKNGLKKELIKIKLDKSSVEYKILKFLKKNKKIYTYRELSSLIKNKFNKEIPISFLYKLYVGGETQLNYENLI